MKILTVVLLVLSTVLFSQEILFEDDFSDGTADGWIPLFGEGTYFVNDSLRYDISYTGTNYVTPAVIRGDSASIYMSLNDYSVLLEGIAHSPSAYIGIYLRGTLAHTGYSMYGRYDFNDIVILRHDGPGSHTFLDLISFPLVYDEHYWLRFQCEGDTLRGKVWQGSAGDEPAAWLLTAFDAAYDDYGFMGFVTGRYSSSPGDSHAEFDNVVVTAVEPVAYEQSTWGMIKSVF